VFSVLFSYFLEQKKEIYVFVEGEKKKKVFLGVFFLPFKFFLGSK